MFTKSLGSMFASTIFMDLLDIACLGDLVTVCLCVRKSVGWLSGSAKV
jgi:hypothetical protein